MPKVTLTTLDQKLSDVLVKLDKHEELLQGTIGIPGMRINLDRLLQREEDRKWHFRAIWAAMIAALIGGWFR
jgi:hypothetical protein